MSTLILVGRLRSVPLNSRYIHEVDSPVLGATSYPIGHLCHEAAAEMERLALCHEALKRAEEEITNRVRIQVELSGKLEVAKHDLWCAAQGLADPQKAAVDTLKRLGVEFRA